MPKPGKRDIARAVLTRYPKSQAEELHIAIARNTPAPLYQWLIASLLFSARIGSRVAQHAAGDLFEQGWRTPRKMAGTSWEERVKVLNRSGYARYDESTARYIADTTTLLQERYGGDLRRLRDAAERDPARIRTLLKQFKGIGDVGADIFFREAQIPWPELYPFADGKALGTARKLALGSTAKELARLAPRQQLPRLLSGLVRIGQASEEKAVLAEAA